MSESEASNDANAAPAGFWQRRLRDGVGGAAEALFPTNDFGAPDWRDTRIIERTESYIEELPAPSARLIRLLFIALELLFPLLAPAFGRFSRLSLARRTRILEGWRTSNWHLLHQLFDAVRGLLAMMYLSHPDVVRHIKTVKVCDRPWDTTLPMEVQVDALVDQDSRLEAEEAHS